MYNNKNLWVKHLFSAVLYDIHTLYTVYERYFELFERTKYVRGWLGVQQYIFVQMF